MFFYIGFLLMFLFGEKFTYETVWSLGAIFNSGVWLKAL